MLALPLLWGCEKESLLNETTESAVQLEFRDNHYAGLDTTIVVSLIDSIMDFKASLDDWRAGNRLTEQIDGQNAIEMMEMTANFYLSRPAKAFAEYHFFRDSVVLSALPATWNGTQAAKVFNDVKQRLTTHFNAVNGTDKNFRFLDFATVSDSSGSYLYIAGQIGRTEISQPETPIHPELRWARGSAGFDQTVTCPPSAEEEIGKAVNSQLGFFLQNLPPSPINCCNPLERPNTVIVGPIEFVQTNFLGIDFPLAGAGSPLFTVSTFFNPADFENNTDLGNTPTDYPLKGQYKIHADAEFGGAEPDEHCFSITKVASYIASNLKVGNSYIPRVNQESSSPFPLTLIATNVQNEWGGTEQPNPPSGPGIIKVQEHPTYHFYAFLLPIAFPSHFELTEL
ncbi:MAG: hypothetical protein GVY26_01220 [Bacteroidetes bacterium]|nr:hypothetical protein [Bacteroidota bacterium]